MIETYPEMDAQIVGLLKQSDSAIEVYAAKRIEELEQKIEQQAQEIERLNTKLNQYKGIGLKEVLDSNQSMSAKAQRLEEALEEISEDCSIFGECDCGSHGIARQALKEVKGDEQK